MPDEPLTTAGQLGEQAERCRRLERQTSDRQVAGRLLEIAEEFDKKAASYRVARGDRESCLGGR